MPPGFVVQPVIPCGHQHGRLGRNFWILLLQNATKKMALSLRFAKGVRDSVSGTFWYWPGTDLVMLVDFSQRRKFLAPSCRPIRCVGGPGTGSSTCDCLPPQIWFTVTAVTAVSSLKNKNKNVVFCQGIPSKMSKVIIIENAYLPAIRDTDILTELSGSTAARCQEGMHGSTLNTF